jgi:WD40 repeat protein
LELGEPDLDRLKSIRDLIVKLDDDSYDVRLAAAESLEKIGMSAVPELVKSLRSDSAEVRIRSRFLLCEIRALKPWKTFTGHRTAVSSALFLPDGKIIASGTSDGTVKLWELATQTEIATLAR